MWLALFVLFGFVVALFAVLIIGARRKWPLVRIGGGVFLVIGLSNVAIAVGSGESTMLTVMGIEGGLSAAAALFGGDYLRTLAAREPSSAGESVGTPNAEFAGVTDDEMSAYVKQLSVITAKRMGSVRLMTMLMLLPAGLIFVPEDLGLPPFVPMVLLGAIFFATIPLFVRFWRTDVSRMDAVAELMRRGLDLPAGVQPVKPAAADATRRTAVPMIVSGCCMIGIIAWVVLLVLDVLPDTLLSVIAVYALMFGLVASLVWTLVVQLGSMRAKAPADSDSTGDAA